MDPYEATKVVFSRVQSLDPENASKIMGLILIQDHGEKEMIRLAFGPETLLHSVMLKARLELGISPNTNPRLLPPSSWSPSGFHDDMISPTSNGLHLSSSNSSKLNPATPPFYSELMDEIQLQEQLGFLNDGQPDLEVGVGGAYNWNNLAHRRSYSVSDINFGDDPSSGLGWKPCLYYARGFCKNGSSCRFNHGGEVPDAKMEVMEQCHELLRSKSMQHHKLMAAMASNSPTFPRSIAALMMNEELNKISRTRLENGRGVDLNSASRQIYLTFPADSTFREEDVSNYFSIYGPVQDVRIPYQQKRMFGFVTFVYPETVKMILAKGNPHFVCDARVLVKPYKEKGKVPDKFRKQQQQMEMGEFSGCNSPTALDSRDPFDIQLGSKMMYDTQYLLWKRKLEEQADLELQTRRLMGLQLLDVKRNHHRSLSTGAPIPSPTQSPNSFFHKNVLGSDRSSPDDNCHSPPLHEATDTEKEGSVGEDNSNNCSVKEGPFPQHNNLLERQCSLELNLPDSPFAPQTRGGSESEDTGIPIPIPIPIPGAYLTNSNTKGSSLNLPPPFNSCYFQMPRFSPGHGGIEM